ncbi:EF-hand_domain pair [Hexamita inflata]|uniref:EF-hand domain pair n=1 Tax=Hexamita inflata TaxID=28002 RepID=A0AA86NCP0_9EUKA|nr:EF-hand domain pair [Hexamita inflata]CAI9937727.1 EF-hand domain pair [Hexamita inflata]
MLNRQYKDEIEISKEVRVCLQKIFVNYNMTEEQIATQLDYAKSNMKSNHSFELFFWFLDRDQDQKLNIQDIQVLAKSLDLELEENHIKIILQSLQIEADQIKQEQFDQIMIMLYQLLAEVGVYM